VAFFIFLLSARVHRHYEGLTDPLHFSFMGHFFD
jgi:hypothetical protein